MYYRFLSASYSGLTRGSTLCLRIAYSLPYCACHHPTHPRYYLYGLPPETLPAQAQSRDTKHQCQVDILQRQMEELERRSADLTAREGRLHDQGEALAVDGARIARQQEDAEHDQSEATTAHRELQAKLDAAQTRLLEERRHITEAGNRTKEAAEAAAKQSAELRTEEISLQAEAERMAQFAAEVDQKERALEVRATQINRQADRLVLDAREATQEADQARRRNDEVSRDLLEREKDLQQGLEEAQARGRVLREAGREAQVALAKVESQQMQAELRSEQLDEQRIRLEVYCGFAVVCVRS